MVSRLSGMDGLSLHTETATMSSHAVALIIIEASADLSHQALGNLVASSLPQMARFRSRLIDKPLGLGQPVWGEITDFDPAGQIHQAAVPQPGGNREFADLIGELTQGPLNRDRPLWEAWSIDGLPEGRWALAVKISHAMSDGVGGVASILPRLLTVSPGDDAGSYLPAEPTLGGLPSTVDLVTDTAKELVGNQVTGVRLLGSALPGLARAVVRRVGGGGEKASEDDISPMTGPLPRTVFNDRLTERRAVAFATVPLADMKAVKNAFDVSINDVFLAACTLSVRRWLQRHASIPEHALSMQVPVSLRDAGSTTIDNQFTFVRVRFPVQLTDGVQILQELHSATQAFKIARTGNTPAARPAVDMPTIAGLIPPNVIHAGWQLYEALDLSQRLPPISHGIASNIPGPPVPVYCAGAKVVGMHIAAPLVEGSGLNITLISHGATTDISVCVCPDAVPAVEEIADGIVDSVAVLREAANHTAEPVTGIRRRSATGKRASKTARSAGDPAARQ